MIRLGFYKEKEAEFTKVWLLDLVDIGYVFPAVQN